MNVLHIEDRRENRLLVRKVLESRDAWEFVSFERAEDAPPGLDRLIPQAASQP